MQEADTTLHESHCQCGIHIGIRNWCEFWHVVLSDLLQYCSNLARC